MADPIYRWHIHHHHNHWDPIQFLIYASRTDWLLSVWVCFSTFEGQSISSNHALFQKNFVQNSQSCDTDFAHGDSINSFTCISLSTKTSTQRTWKHYPWKNRVPCLKIIWDKDYMEFKLSSPSFSVVVTYGPSTRGEFLFIFKNICHQFYFTSADGDFQTHQIGNKNLSYFAAKHRKYSNPYIIG